MRPGSPGSRLLDAALAVGAGTPGARPAVAAPPRAPRTAAELWGAAPTPSDSVVVLASAGEEPPPPGELVDGGAADGLLDFLDGMDDTIPVSRRVVAVVNARPASRAAVAAPWLADHPRWNVRSAMSHASWVSEVDDLLAHRAACSADERSALRRRLAAGAAITWTSRP